MTGASKSSLQIAQRRAASSWRRPGAIAESGKSVGSGMSAARSVESDGGAIVRGAGVQLQTLTRNRRRATRRDRDHVHVRAMSQSHDVAGRRLRLTRNFWGALPSCIIAAPRLLRANQAQTHI